MAVPPAASGGELHLIGSTKCIHINRGILAPIFGLPPGALRLTEVDVGGGFGVRGELYPEDILVPPVSSRDLHARIPGSELVAMEDAGHLHFIEQAERFTATSLEFLEKHRGA